MTPDNKALNDSIVKIFAENPTIDFLLLSIDGNVTIRSRENEHVKGRGSRQFWGSLIKAFFSK